jgi:hypothetical protein
MAAFPYTKQGITTKRMGVDITRAINGTARAKSWYTNIKHNFEVSLPMLTQQEFELLEAFISVNRATPVDLHYEPDGVAYPCIITSFDVSALGACKFAVRVSMVEL